MGARQKLNQSYIHAALIVAAVVGGLADAWKVVLFTAVLGVVFSLCAGDIRLGHRRR